MNLHNNRGLTLIESLVSIALISVLLLGVIGAFYIAKVSVVHARHRMAAMGLVREYLEREIALGYYYGSYQQSSAVSRTIDGITYTVTPAPNPATVASEGGVSYKTIGFRVTWSEPRYGGGSLTCTERAVTSVANH